MQGQRDGWTGRCACTLVIALLSALVGLWPLSARSEWKFLAIQDGVTLLVDRSTISTAGAYKRIWLLQNYPMPTVYGAQSITMLMEVECPKYRLRFNQLHAYAGQTQSGTALESIYEPGPWERVSQGPFRSVFDLLCRTNDPRFDTSTGKP
jgi:hypothetical protein